MRIASAPAPGWPAPQPVSAAIIPHRYPNSCSPALRGERSGRYPGTAKALMILLAPVRYLHLAHNAWDGAAGRSVPKVLYSFGREDTLDRAAIKRLVASLSKLLDPAGALAATAGPDLVFLESRPFGGAFVLDTLWRRLGIDKVITGLDRGPRRGRPRDAAATERVLFGLVAN